MTTYTRFQVNSPSVVAEEIDGEVVIVNLETGRYYSLRDGSALLWKLLEGGAAAEEATQLLAGGNGAVGSPVRDEIASFIGELVAEKLVVESGEQTAPASVPHPDGHLLPGSLRLERYDEMQEMLLYDPIHDVDETGWPNRPETMADRSEGDPVGPPQER